MSLSGGWPTHGPPGLARGARSRSPKRRKRETNGVTRGTRLRSLSRFVADPFVFVRRVGREALERRIFFLASAVAFDALLAAIPFTLLVLGVVGYALHAIGVSETDVHGLLDEFLPAHDSGGSDPFSTYEEIAQTLAQNRGQLSIWGAPLFLWFATHFYGTVRHALNVIFAAPEKRRWFVALGTDASLAVVTVLLFAINAVLTGQTFVGGWPARFLGLLSAFGFGVLLFATVYAMAPARRLPWHTVVVASLVASLAFELAKRLFALYLAQFATMDRLASNANVIAILLFVIWLNYMAFAFLLGAVVAGTYDGVMRERRLVPRTT